jgi:hypothetical protein
MKFFNVLIISILTFSCSHAQILGGIVNQATRKLERKIEDKIIQAVSDELVRRAFRPLESSIDSIMRQKYQDSINNGQPIDWEKTGAAYADFLDGMNKAVELPVKYTFDVTQEIEIVDYNKKRNYIKLHYSKNDPVMAIENIDNAQNNSFVVIDMSKDAMILYATDKKGKKTGQIVPSITQWSKSLVQTATNDDINEPYDIVMTGKTKKIAGYNSNEFKGTSKDEKVTMYISVNFPVNTQKSFQAYLSKLAPQAYNENISKATDNGVMMEFENTRTDEKGEKTTWVTKKVTEKLFDIINEEYGLYNEK